MRIRSLPLLLPLLTLAVPAFADDVYLVNGRKFEGVIAETSDTQVRIRMQGGTLSLPKDQVLRIEQGESSLAEYLSRKEALKKNPATRAADWLELSRWAHGRELDQAAREAALTAAVLDPRAEGLGPVLRGHGYVLDSQLDRWIPYAESMRRRGFVLAGGQWISRDEYQARVRAQEEDQARRRAAQQEAAREAREERLAALAELSMVRQITQPPAPAVPAYPPGYGYPYGGTVFVMPGWWNPSPDGGGQKPPQSRHGGQGLGTEGFVHIPGSLIPGTDFPGQGQGHGRR
jgi:hypothetical protein